jgi:deoxycytidylate deaminase
MTDAEFLRFACRTARQESHDARTQCAALIFNAEADKMAWGVNHFPPGCPQTQARKGDYMEHAERAAIYACARHGVATKGCVMYAPWFACPECARAIIISGIKEVVGLCRLRDLTAEKWRKPIEIADEMLTDAGVSLRWVNEKMGVTLMFDGKAVFL